MNATTKDKVEENDDDDDDDDDDDGNGHASGLGATDYYYADNEARASSKGASARSAKVAGRIATKSGYAGGDASTSTSASRKPLAYGPEQAMTNLKYRFGPNYSIVRRVLTEVQSLLGGGG